MNPKVGDLYTTSDTSSGILIVVYLDSQPGIEWKDRVFVIHSKGPWKEKYSWLAGNVYHHNLSLSMWKKL